MHCRIHTNPESCQIHLLYGLPHWPPTCLLYCTYITQSMTVFSRVHSPSTVFPSSSLPVLVFPVPGLREIQGMCALASCTFTVIALFAFRSQCRPRREETLYLCSVPSHPVLCEGRELSLLVYLWWRNVKCVVAVGRSSKWPHELRNVTWKKKYRIDV